MLDPGSTTLFGVTVSVKVKVTVKVKVNATANGKARMIGGFDVPQPLIGHVGHFGPSPQVQPQE
jgi:hypothetical protein